MPARSSGIWLIQAGFFETFVLERVLKNYQPFHPKYRYLFNSYYNSIGARHPRPQRGLLSRPSLEEVYEYRDYVNRNISQWLGEGEISSELAEILQLGLQHEQQHQELILTDIKHLLSLNPLKPSYTNINSPAIPRAESMFWIRYEPGLHWIGHHGKTFGFDNEGPLHKVFLRGFELASRLCTNEEFLKFIDEGGYERPELWLADGWDIVSAQQWKMPLYWEKTFAGWKQFTMAGLQDLVLEEPISHISYYEADAFARWAGARLPTEQEWEVAAQQNPIEGNLLERGIFHPQPAFLSSPSTLPEQIFGDVWEWTQSAYLPYPGYQPAAGALGEYNGKFMCNQMVLRGGSCFTPQSHIRASYRNFFYPNARWQCSGVRLVRDI